MTTVFCRSSGRTSPNSSSPTVWCKPSRRTSCRSGSMKNCLPCSRTTRRKSGSCPTSPTTQSIASTRSTRAESGSVYTDWWSKKTTPQSCTPKPTSTTTPPKTGPTSAWLSSLMSCNLSRRVPLPLWVRTACPNSDSAWWSRMHSNPCL